MYSNIKLANYLQFLKLSLCINIDPYHLGNFSADGVPISDPGSERQKMQEPEYTYSSQQEPFVPVKVSLVYLISSSCCITMSSSAVL